MKRFIKNLLFIITVSCAIGTGVLVAKGFVEGVSIASNAIDPQIEKISMFVSNIFEKGEEVTSQTANASDNEDDISNSPINLENISDEQFTPPPDGKMIRINLETMSVITYEDGKVVDEFDVLAKGKPGSYWETPGGEFRIQTKEERHLSSVGRAWMPWSMQFFGNFFIHGWPTYENGTPYPKGSGYSGGCIRLSDENAEKLFEWADIGTTISIFSEKEIKSENIVSGNYFKINPKLSPKVSAQAYAVGDLETGDVIIEKNGEEIRPIASITKLVTALTALDVVSQRKTISITSAMLAVQGENGGFRAGEKIQSNDLVYPLVLVSSNDAAEILARYAGKENFIRFMNEKVSSMGLTETYFEDPSGLSDNNLSSAYDLLRLSRYMYLYKPFVLEMSILPSYRTKGHYWDNTSQFLDIEGYKGGKRGYTYDAGETSLAIFEVPMGEFSNRTIAIIVLGSVDRYKDTIEIMKYVKENTYYQPNQ